MRNMLFYLLFMTSPLILNAQANNCLQAYYPFSSNALDESGYGNHATVFGAKLTNDRFGNPNNAYEFKASNSTYIDLNHAFDFPQRTINLWVNTKSVENSEPHIYISDHPSLKNGFSQIKNNVILNDTVLISSACLSRQIAIKKIKLNSWHMVSLVIDHDSVRHYFDAQLVQVYPVNTQTSRDGHNTALLGASRLFDRFFTGVIDDVRIYDCALSDEDIQSLYFFNPVANKHFAVYPNPNLQKITIKGITEGVFKIELRDAKGQKFNQAIENNTVNLLSLPAGLYYLYIRDKKGDLLHTEKIVKM